MAVVLREIDKDNFAECIKLEVAPEQKDFVASNVVSIAQSKVYSHMVPMAVYNDDVMVGFVMYGCDPDTLQYWVIRLMIETRRQREGLGRAAMLELIKLLRKKENCDQISLSLVPENTGAQSLYSSLGFERTGEIDEGEIVMRLSFANNEDQGPQI